MSEGKNQNVVYPSQLKPSERYGTAGIAASREVSVLGPLTDAHIAALVGRGLDIELLAKLGVGASPKLGAASIGIPYLAKALNGPQQIGCKHRTIMGEKKFTQDAGSAQVFYNKECLEDETLRHDPLVITEGELDCISALQAGYPKAVSVPGGAPLERLKDDGGKKYGFLDDAWHLTESVEKIILAVDNDEPGANLRDDLALRLGTYRCYFVKYPEGCKDLNDVLRLKGEQAVRTVLQSAQPLKIHGYYELDELPPTPSPTAYDTGIIGFSQHYKLRLGDLCVVTGVPGHGKSSFINEICCRMAAKHNWKTVFASFEQAAGSDHRRALRSFRIEKLETMMSHREQAEADAWIRQHFGFIVPDTDDDVTLPWMLSTLEQAVLRKEAQIAVIDPWNEMDHTRPKDMTLTEYTGYAIKQFKKFARKYNIHLIVAAHPAKMRRDKDGNYPMPSMYDVSDSAHWANKPDVGIVIHRADLSRPETTIKVAKTRYHTIGVAGEIQGAWNIDRTRYTVIEPEAMR